MPTAVLLADEAERSDARVDDPADYADTRFVVGASYSLPQSV